MPGHFRSIAFVATLSAWVAATGETPSAAPPETAGLVTLTAEEQAWVAAHPVIRVGHLGGAGPFSFYDSSGNLTGLNLDYLELIAQRTGLHFQHLPDTVWARLFDGIRAGKVDVIIGIGRTKQREEFMRFTTPYAFSPDVIVTRLDAPVYFDLRDMGGRRVGISGSNPSLKTSILERSPTAVVVEYDNMREAVRAVAQRQVYAAVADAVITGYVIKTDGLANLRLGVIYDDNANLHMGVRPDWPELTAILDKGLASITAVERNRIKDRWLSIDFMADALWRTAFRVAAGLAVAATIFFLFVYVLNRRLAGELAERRRIQLALEDAHAQLARVSEEKSEILRMVAHDLRSPLTSLLLGAEILETDIGPANKAAQDTLGHMRVTTQQMIRMAGDLVDVHILEEGRREFEWGQIDFCSILREAVATLGERATQKKIRLDLRTAEPVMPLQSDATALRQVVDNLISNALKYSPANTEVMVDLRRSDRGYRLLVCDQGPGVKPEEREKIFEKYGRGSVVPTGGEKSTGLGLWIVRRFVLALHGRVWHEPGPSSSGSVFIVELPLAPPKV